MRRCWDGVFGRDESKPLDDPVGLMFFDTM